MNQIVLITGASSGIGRQVAIDLSQDYSVILCGRNEENLNKTEEMCSPLHEHYAWKYDLGEITELENSLTQFLTERKLAVSYFVHCAGIMNMIPLKMVKYEVFEKALHINLTSVALIVKVLIKKINQSALKSCVFISSNISNRGAKAFGIYGAAKSGLDGLMRNLSIELAPNVRLNSILPGAVHTEMTSDIFANEEVVERMKKTYPLGLGETKDISSAVVFLLSDKARWITGQQITVDGGRTIDISG